MTWTKNWNAAGIACRYADDCNIYVQSQTASERVLASATAFFGRKTQVARSATSKHQ
jgi:retron-type reverse transcriptase